MRSPLSRTARNTAVRAILWLLLPVTGLAVPAAGEEEQAGIRAVSGGREQMRIDQRVQAAGAAWNELGRDARQGLGLDIKVVAAAAYDDNIFLSANDPQSDLVVTVAPRAALGVGAEQAEDGAFLRAAYQPALVIYQENSSSTRVDHALELSAGWRGKVIEVAYRGDLRRLGDVTADAGTPADRTEDANLVRVVWRLREKIVAGAVAGTAGTAYDSAVFFDNRRDFAGVTVDYEYSPKTRLGLAYRMGRERVDGSGDQTARQILARFAWQPREKVSLDLGAGVERRKFDLGSSTEPLFDGRIGWRPREGTEIYLAGFLREEASGFFEGQNYRIGSASLGIAQDLGRGWLVRVEGGRERATYTRVSGSGPANREDRTFFIEPAVEYAPSEALRVGLFHRISENRSSQDGFGYDNHQTGVRLEYQF